jgi:hypothetical protein
MLHILSMLLFLSVVLSSPVNGDRDIPLNKARYQECIKTLRANPDGIPQPLSWDPVKMENWQGDSKDGKYEDNYPLTGQLCSSYGPSVLAIALTKTISCTNGYVAGQIEQHINNMSNTDFDSESIRSPAVFFVRLISTRESFSGYPVSG